MSSMALAIFLKPIIFIVVFGLPVYAVRKWARPGFLKDLLLFQIHDERRYTIGESWRALLNQRWR